MYLGTGGKRHKIPLTSFYIWHHKLQMGIPVYPEILRWSWRICQLLFKINYFTHSFSLSFSYSTPQSPHLLTSNSTNLTGFASICCPSPSYHVIRIPSPIKAQSLHLCPRLQPFSFFEEICYYFLFPFFLHQFSSTESFLTSNMLSDSHLKK